MKLGSNADVVEVAQRPRDVAARDDVAVASDLRLNPFGKRQLQEDRLGVHEAARRRATREVPGFDLERAGSDEIGRARHRRPAGEHAVRVVGRPGACRRRGEENRRWSQGRYFQTNTLVFVWVFVSTMRPLEI